MCNAEHRWLSIHLEFPASKHPARDIYGPPCDRILRRIVGPLAERFRAEGRVSGLFFIRYRDPGPHVRLRLLGERTEHARLLAEVEERCTEFSALEPAGPSPVRSHPAPYEPELARYGGPTGMAIAERLFETSSDLVLALLPILHRNGQDPELRLGHGVLGIVLLAGALLADEPPERVAEFLTRYGRGGQDRGWELSDGAEAEDPLDTIAGRQASLCASIAGLFDAAMSPQSLTSPLSEAASGFGEARAALVQAWAGQPMPIRGFMPSSTTNALYHLTTSYLHMHLNRLGIPPHREGLVARVAARAVQEEVRCP